MRSTGIKTRPGEEVGKETIRRSREAAKGTRNDQSPSHCFQVPLVQRQGPHDPAGHSGSTGLFLYCSKDLSLYMAGSINQVDAKSKPFRLMLKLVKGIQSKK